jgi:hypothetical protein
MKKLLVLIALATLVLFKAQSQTRSAWRTLYMTNTSTTIPSNFVSGLVIGGATNIYASRVTIIGKASPRANNAGTVYIGTSSGDDSQPYPVTAGGEVVLRAPDTAPFNLRDWYVDVLNAGDGVTIIFQ